MKPFDVVFEGEIEDTLQITKNKAKKHFGFQSIQPRNYMDFQIIT